MKTWRLLEVETCDAYTNMAVDEAILNARIAGLVPNTIRFYRWNPSAVSIGKFQDVENEVQIDNCKKFGVDIVRRITGGGTVYHDGKDEITYSVVASKQDLGTQDIAEVYAQIYSGLVEALRILGITADFNTGNEKTCPNLTVKGKKISGSAQAHKSGTVLQHGTLLTNVNLERMFTFLRVPWARTCMEVANIAKDKMTSLSLELGKQVLTEEVRIALVQGFQKALNIKLEKDELTTYEQQLSKELRKSKYTTDEWNFHRKD